MLCAHTVMLIAYPAVTQMSAFFFLSTACISGPSATQGSLSSLHAAGAADPHCRVYHSLRAVESPETVPSFGVNNSLIDMITVTSNDTSVSSTGLHFHHLLNAKKL